MKSTTKKLSPTSVEVTVTIDAADFANYKNQAVELLAEDLKLPGFRKGKVPADVARKNLDPSALARAALDIAVRTTAPKVLADAELVPLVAPDINVTKFVPDELVEYVAKVEIIPEIKLGKTSGLKVKKQAVEVAAKDVDQTLDNIRRSFAESATVNREAKLGDEVLIDFVGKKDGVAFEGGSAKGYKLTLGSGQFIPGFEDGIVGHKVGDEFDLKLTFPKDYGNQDLAGAKVVFTVLLKQVNELVLPELTDEFATKCGPFKTIAELKADIKKNLKAQDEHKALDQYKDALVSELIAGSKVPTPEILVEDQLKAIRADIEHNLEHRGATWEQYLASTHQTKEQWETDAKKVATTRVQAALVLTELAKQEKLVATDEETESKIAELKDVYKKSPDALKQLENPRVFADIKQRLTIEKAIDKLVSLNSK